MPLGFRRRGLAGPGLPGASLDLWDALKCLCVARKFNSGLYNGIESPERSQRATLHRSAKLRSPVSAPAPGAAARGMQFCNK